jgi:Flp pilus assembly pilin Flp
MLPNIHDATRAMRHLLRDDNGQDLVEHALLTGIISVGAILLFANAANTLQAVYVNRNNAAENAWQPCPPQPAPCP